MQVRIGLVNQQHGRRPGVQERKQHQDLLESAAAARNIEPCAAIPIVRENIRAGRIRRHQPVVKEPPYRLF